MFIIEVIVVVLHWNALVRKVFVTFCPLFLCKWCALHYVITLHL